MDGYEFLNMTLKRIHDQLGYVLVVARGDGKTLLLGTDNARNRLALVNGASPLEHVVSAYRTDHFREIARSVASRFRLVSEDGFGLWFLEDPNRLHEAIAEYDLETGKRIRAGLLEVGAPAWVKTMGSGVVTKLSDYDVAVRLDQPRGKSEVVYAHRSLVKPYIRAAA
jgi:hypothetical protein